MSTPEAVDPLVQLEADEAADRASEATPVAAEPQGDAAPVQPDEPQQHPWASEFSDPVEMWHELQKSRQSVENGTRKIGEQGNELGELRQFRQQAEPIIQQAYQQQQAQQQPQYGQQRQALPDGTPILTVEQMTELRDDDPAAYADLMVQYRTYEMEQRFEQRLDQALADRLGPLEAAHVDRGARETLDKLKSELGADTVAQHAELVGDLLREDRAHYADPKHGARRLKEAIVTAAWERERQGGAPQAPREPIRDVHVEGGSGAQPQVAGGTRLDPEEQEIVDSLTWSRPVDEMGIPLPP